MNLLGFLVSWLFISVLFYAYVDQFGESDEIPNSFLSGFIVVGFVFFFIWFLG